MLRHNVYNSHNKYISRVNLFAFTCDQAYLYPFGIYRRHQDKPIFTLCNNIWTSVSHHPHVSVYHARGHPTTAGRPLWQWFNKTAHNDLWWWNRIDEHRSSSRAHLYLYIFVRRNILWTARIDINQVGMRYHNTANIRVLALR